MSDPRSFETIEGVETSQGLEFLGLIFVLVGVGGGGAAIYANKKELFSIGFYPFLPGVINICIRQRKGDPRSIRSRRHRGLARAVVTPLAPCLSCARRTGETPKGLGHGATHGFAHT